MDIAGAYARGANVQIKVSGARGGRGAKGEPGGNALAIGTLNDASDITVPAGTDLVIISGIAAIGDDGAGMRLAYDPAVDAAYVAANPTTSFRDQAGRGFRVALDRASRVRFLGRATGGQADTVEGKLGETIELFDQLTLAQKSAVRSGQAPDIIQPLNAIINYANGGESTGDAVGGKTLYIGGGRYIVSDTIKSTFRFDNGIVDDGDLRRLNIEGDGACNTSLFYTGPANKPAFQMRGNNNLDGRESGQFLRGFRLRRNFGVRGSAVGFDLRYLAGLFFDDVHVDGFDLGFNAVDVLGFYARDLFILGNNVGLRAQVGDWTRPNVYHFWGGAVSGNAEVGAHFKEGANVGFYGTRWEGNGTGDNGDTVLLLEQAPAEGGAWAQIENGYFEGNAVDADINVANGSTNSGVVTVNNCSFNRVGNDRVAKHHIDVYTGGPGRTVVNVRGCAFRGFGGYTPDVSRSAVRNQSPALARVHSDGNFFHSALETIETNNAPTPGFGYLQPAAGGVVSNNGVATKLQGENFTVERRAQGTVRINFVQALASNAPAGYATPIGTTGVVASVTDYFSTYIEFSFVDSATKASVDCSFSFTAFGPLS